MNTLEGKERVHMRNTGTDRTHYTYWHTEAVTERQRRTRIDKEHKKNKKEKEKTGGKKQK